jgi:hypothetical protein
MHVFLFGSNNPSTNSRIFWIDSPSSRMPHLGATASPRRRLRRRSPLRGKSLLRGQARQRQHLQRASPAATTSSLWEASLPDPTPRRCEIASSHASLPDPAPRRCEIVLPDAAAMPSSRLSPTGNGALAGERPAPISITRAQIQDDVATVSGSHVHGVHLPIDVSPTA